MLELAVTESHLAFSKSLFLRQDLHRLLLLWLESCVIRVLKANNLVALLALRRVLQAALSRQLLLVMGLQLVNFHFFERGTGCLKLR